MHGVALPVCRYLINHCLSGAKKGIRMVPVEHSNVVFEGVNSIRKKEITVMFLKG